MQIIERKLTDLVPYQTNPRINDDAVEKVAASIQEFGFNVPILVNRENVIVAGHTRLKAAQLLGLESVPCIVIDLDENEINQYRIVDNKTGELSSWDYAKLVEEIEGIDEIDLTAFGLSEFFEADQVVNRDYDTVLGEGVEIDIDDFDDEVFDNECPYCGFRW